MRMRMTILCLAILPAACGRIKGGGHGSGASGGDPIRTRVSEGRLAVVDGLGHFDEKYLNDSVSPAVRDFLLTNAAMMAEDARNSPHVYVDKGGRCASTERQRDAQIEFNIDFCARQVRDDSDIYKLLVHETAHHFGVESEEMADLIAIAAFNAEQGRRAANPTPDNPQKSEDSTGVFNDGGG